MQNLDIFVWKIAKFLCSGKKQEDYNIAPMSPRIMLVFSREWTESKSWIMRKVRFSSEDAGSNPTMSEVVHLRYLFTLSGVSLRRRNSFNV